MRTFLRLCSLFYAGIYFFVYQAGQFYFIEALHLLGYHMIFVVLRTVKETHCTYFIFSHITAWKEKSVQILCYTFSEGWFKSFIAVLWIVLSLNVLYCILLLQTVGHREVECKCFTDKICPGIFHWGCTILQCQTCQVTSVFVLYGMGSLSHVNWQLFGQEDLMHSLWRIQIWKCNCLHPVFLQTVSVQPASASHPFLGGSVIFIFKIPNFFMNPIVFFFLFLL
jgi:hypothetical protein